jgi:putative Mn2+ efflux pump MntP
VSIFKAAAIIGLTTFFITMAGVKIGNLFGARFKSKAELTGGLALILLGIKILVEGLFFK